MLNKSKEATSSPQPYWLQLLMPIFSRPPLAALFVGSAIHGLSYLNASLVGVEYLANITDAFDRALFFGLFKVLIPYFVPFVVTSIARTLNNHRHREFIAEFPEMNPDLVFKLSQDNTINYWNPTVRTYLQRLGFPESCPEALLPPSYQDVASSVQGRDIVETVSHSIDNVDFQFSFRSKPESNTVFISGRDTTESQTLSRRLTRTLARTDMMTDFLGHVFSDSSSEHIDIQRVHREILTTLLAIENQSKGLTATHVFLAENNGDKLSGHIYCPSENGVQRLPDAVTLDPSRERYAILEGVGKMVWSNWEDHGESLESYQRQFHPQVRDRIGIIERFATFTNGRIALIAFYTGRKLTELDASLLKELAIFSSGLHRIAFEQHNTEQAFVYTAEALARASEVNDEDTGDHILRLNEYSAALAKHMGQDEHFIRTISYSAQLHDIGKIHIHPDCLKKPGKLTDNEFKKMQQHATYGMKILGDSPRLAMAREIAGCHHERFDGSGYPNGLKGDEIPLPARIVAVADVYDALRQKRVYKPPFSHEKACTILLEGDGRVEPSHFDPVVLKAFAEIAETMSEIFDRGQNKSEPPVSRASTVSRRLHEV